MSGDARLDSAIEAALALVHWTMASENEAQIRAAHCVYYYLLDKRLKAKRLLPRHLDCICYQKGERA